MKLEEQQLWRSAIDGKPQNPTEGFTKQLKCSFSSYPPPLNYDGMECTGEKIARASK